MPESYGTFENITEIAKILISFCTGIGKLLLDELQEIRYIGPLRKLPERNFLPHYEGEESRWADGLGAWDRVYNNLVSISEVNYWLAKLKIGYTLERKLYREVPEDFLNNEGPSVDKEIIDVLGRLKKESEDLAINRELVTNELLRGINSFRLQVDFNVESFQKTKDKIGKGVEALGGTIVGAMIGGPIGGVLGGVAGLWGDYYSKKISQEDLTKKIEIVVNKLLMSETRKLQEGLKEFDDKIQRLEGEFQKIFSHIREDLDSRIEGILDSIRRTLDQLHVFFEKTQNNSSIQMRNRDIYSEFAKFPVKSKIFFQDLNGNQHYSYDLGVGISQVFPIIICALDQKTRLAAFEQPELHIHPAVQVELADLFIDQIKDGNKMFLIETHSEHLMLRLLRRIEDKHLNNMGEEKHLFDHGKLAVYWSSNDNDGQVITLLPVDITGEFTRRWPKGFFEERAEELFAND